MKKGARDQRIARPIGGSTSVKPPVTLGVVCEGNHCLHYAKNDVRLCRIDRPIKPRPMIIMAQLEGSGTPPTAAME